MTSEDYPDLDLEDGERPWWDTNMYSSTVERVEAMKRQDPDYNEEENE